MHGQGESELMLLVEVSRYTRAPLSTVRWWTKRGLLRSVKIGKRRLVHRDWLAEFLRDAETKDHTS